MKKIKNKDNLGHKPTKTPLCCEGSFTPCCAHADSTDKGRRGTLTVGFTSSWPVTVNMRERPTGVHTAGRPMTGRLTSDPSRQTTNPERKANPETLVLRKFWSQTEILLLFCLPVLSKRPVMPKERLRTHEAPAVE